MVLAPSDFFEEGEEWTSTLKALSSLNDIIKNCPDIHVRNSLGNSVIYTKHIEGFSITE